MSIATVVTMGFGSFGSVNLLPTIGYGAFAGLPPVEIRACIDLPRRAISIDLPGRKKHIDLPRRAVAKDLIHQ